MHVNGELIILKAIEVFSKLKAKLKFLVYILHMVHLW